MIPSTKEIRKELALLIAERTKGVKKAEVINSIVNKCREEINKKYGKGWREQI